MTRQTHNPVVWIARVTARNYDFSAAGLTRDSARTAVLLAMSEHGRQMGFQLDWLAPFAIDIDFTTMPIGVGLRDGKPLPRAARIDTRTIN
jgi:hypothetical protein